MVLYDATKITDNLLTFECDEIRIKNKEVVVTLSNLTANKIEYKSIITSCRSAISIN